MQKNILTKFTDANFLSVDVEDGQETAEKIKLNFPVRNKILPMSEFSKLDLSQLIIATDTKMISFKNQDDMDSFERKYGHLDRFYNISGNRKSLYIKLITKGYRNYLALENDIQGLDLDFDKWIFYGVETSEIGNCSRTTGENLYFIKN